MLASSNPSQGLRSWLVLPFFGKAHQAPGGPLDLHGLPILEARLVESLYQIQKFVYLILGIEKKKIHGRGKKRGSEGGITHR
jgi:hypothetical protein